MSNLVTLSFSGGTLAAAQAAVVAFAATLGTGNSPPVNPPAPSNGTPDAPTSGPQTSPSTSDGERDAAGVLWDPAKHAGTKAKVASGLWRMKVGVKRLPGEGEEAIPKGEGSVAPSASSTGNPPPPPGQPTPPPPPAPAVDPNRPTDAAYRHDNGDGTEQWHVGGAWDGGKHPIPSASPAAPAEEDEFAAFATANSGTPAGTVAARNWTDADLSALCNQAAQKAGTPDPVKAVIADYVPANEIQHSRMVPNEKREEFARALESKIGFQYAA